jgi:hypothetical protein
MTSPITPYITRDEPFGPIDSTDIDLKDVNALEKLFEQHNRIYKHLHHRPSIIMGRELGETSYLRTVFFDRNMIISPRSNRACARYHFKGHSGNYGELVSKRRRLWSTSCGSAAVNPQMWCVWG